MNNNEVLARNYSEGGIELYNCLSELWKNDFETIGCFIGHNGNTQYIGLNRNNNDKLIKFLSLINKDDIAYKDKEIEDVINFIDNNNYKYANIRYYYKGTLKKYINTSDLDLINILKGKYKYKVSNEKLPMYHLKILKNNRKL